MSLFGPAFEYLMDEEDQGRTWKEAVDNNGGGVIAGINSKSYPDQFADIKAIPQRDRGPAIASFYQFQFWMPFRLGEIGSQDIANRVLSMGVNAGPSTSIRLLQEAVYALPDHTNIAVDGKIGPATLSAVNSADQLALLNAFRASRLQHYKDIVARKPEDAVFLGIEEHPGGWWKRAVR